jgi:hypothetical protein
MPFDASQTHEDLVSGRGVVGAAAVGHGGVSIPPHGGGDVERTF